MFTNQYIKFKKMMMLGQNSISFVGHDGAKVTGVGCNWGYNSDIGRNMAYARCQIPAPSGSSTGGVYFGTGSTPPQKTDYKLENPITSGLYITNSGVSEANPSDGVYVYSASYILRNTTDADVTIAEIGLYSYFEAGTSYKGCVLFERTVLDAPITITPGESKLVTYKVTFNQPS